MKKVDAGVGNLFMSNGVCQQCLFPSSVYKVVCEHGHISPFYTMNPFLIFNQHPSLYPDRTSLDESYFGFQRLLHPDKIRQISNTEREWAEAHIGQINQAYKALQSPMLIAKATALYIQNPLTGLEGFDDRDIPMLDAEFLNKIMVLQMSAMPEDVEELFRGIIVDLDNSIKQLNLSEVLNAIARLTYVERLRNLI